MRESIPLHAVSDARLLNTTETVHSRPRPARQGLIRTKIALLCGLATASGLVLAFSLFLIEEWRNERSNYVKAQVELAEAISVEIAATVALAGSAAPGESIFRANRQLSSALWVGEDGRRYHYGAVGGEAPPLLPSRGRTATATFEPNAVVVSAPYFENGRRKGEFVMRADLHSLKVAFGRRVGVAATVALSAALAAASLASLLAAHLLAPLVALQRHITAQRQARNFGARLRVSSNDELGQLTASYNSLLADLAAYDERLRSSLQELTTARDEAQSANTLKTQFLANMSHEIRTPLNGVLGMARVMSMGHLSRAQRGRLEIIQRSGSDLLLILNNILDLSKIEAGRLELETVAFDLEEEVAGICAAFRPMAESKGVSFVLEVAKEARGAWRGDPMRLRQILYNLVSNALKFTERGEVAVRFARPARNQLLIRVTDTGIGIAPEVLPRLFDEFVQADGAIARRFGGTGLGLAISRGLVELMNGEIKVASEPGKGTEFELSLPMLRAARTKANADARPQIEAEIEAGTEAAPDLPALRILAVDDNETNRVVLEALLGALGIVPVMAEDAQQAIDAWKKQEFDLILMDIQMPEMDGVAATKAIRSHESTTGRPRTRIIALTANAMKHQIREYLSSGFDDHVSKPIVLEDLYHRLVNGAETRTTPQSSATDLGLTPES